MGQNPPVTYPQYGQPGGSYGGGGAYGGAEDGIALTLKWFPLTFMYAFFKPVVTIDGQPHQIPWSRRTVVPVPPGQHHVHVHVPYILPPQVGKADTAVQTYPGQPAELEYRAPVWAFSPGSLGPPPQQYNGWMWQILLVAVPLVVILLCCCGVFASSLFSSGS